MKKDKLTKLPQTAMFVAVILLMLAAFVISICIGQFSISLDEIRRILTGGEVSDITRKVFMNLRFPRTCMAMLAGIGLGTSGCIYQTIFKNPLASPDIVGVAPGANLGAAIAIVMLGGSTLSIATGAFCGGIIVVALVMAIVKIAPTNTTVTYVLAGIIMSHISKAFIMILKFFSDPENELAAIEFWTMGSLANVTAKKTLAIFPIFLVSLIGLILLRRQIDMLSLNEDECRMLGVNVSTVRTIILIFSTLMTASIISVTGLISFVGLIAPHVARMMLKKTGFDTTIMSALVGAVVLLVSDTLARSIYSAEIPISILTTLIGVPILVYFMLKQKEILS